MPGRPSRERCVRSPLSTTAALSDARLLAVQGWNGVDARGAAEDLQVELGDRTVHVDTTTGRIEGEGQQPRLFLRVANWLHLNRGKKVWTLFADAYAVLLLYLAGSGLFMLTGRNGLFGRGALLVLAGILVPVLYPVFGGAPQWSPRGRAMNDGRSIAKTT